MASSNKERKELLELQPALAYSKASRTLDKLFKSSSLESFHNRLLHKRDSSDNNWAEKIRIKNNKKLDRISEEFIKLPKIKNSNFQKQFGSKSNLYQEEHKVNEENGEESDKKDKFFHKKIKILDVNPEPGRYNPNWDSIERNSPRALLIGKRKDPIYENGMLKRTNSMPFAESSKLLNKSLEKKEKDYIDDGKEVKVDYVKRIPYVNQKYNFDNYLCRNDIYFNPEITDILTYVEPDGKGKVEKMHKNVIFKHSVPRKYVPPNENPSPCSYYPKANVVEKNSTTGVVYKTEDKFKKKHYLVQKMWKSYNATIDYRIVQLKSYMEEQKDRKPPIRKL